MERIGSIRRIEGVPIGPYRLPAAFQGRKPPTEFWTVVGFGTTLRLAMLRFSPGELSTQLNGRQAQMTTSGSVQRRHGLAHATLEFHSKNGQYRSTHTGLRE